MTAEEDRPVVIIARHGEKPVDHHHRGPHGVDEHGNHSEHALVPKGWVRSGAIAALLADPGPPLARPARVYATKPTESSPSRRALDTAEVTAARLGVKVNSHFEQGHEKKLARDVLDHGSPAFIVWHHGEIPNLAKHFPLARQDEIPHVWPDDRFDLFWVLTPSAEGYDFQQVPQALLLGDERLDPKCASHGAVIAAAASAGVTRSPYLTAGAMGASNSETYRNTTAIAMSAMALPVLLGAAVLFGLRATFGWLYVVTFALFALYPVALIIRPKVIFDDDAVTFVNVFDSHRFEWRDIQEVRTGMELSIIKQGRRFKSSAAAIGIGGAGREFMFKMEDMINARLHAYRQAHPLPGPGWFPESSGTHTWRWWDGQAWTDHTA